MVVFDQQPVERFGAKMGFADDHYVIKQHQITSTSRMGGFKANVGCLEKVGLASRSFVSSYTNEDVSIVGEFFIRNRANLIHQLHLPSDQSQPICDAELVAAAYSKWRHGCPKYLRGEFAFVAFDRNDDTISCVRDRMGMYPLYYRHQPSGLVFSNSVNTLHNCYGEPAQVNRRRIAEVALGVFEGNVDRTFYANVQSFLPGHIAVFKQGKVIHSRYWEPDPNRRLSCQQEDTFAEFRELLIDTVGSFFDAKANVGVLLSGGLDSSGLASIASEYCMPSGQLLQAYSTVSADRGALNASNDSEYLECYKNQTGIRLNEVLCADKGPLSDVEQAIMYCERPLLMASHYRYQAFGAAASRQGNNILLDGCFGELGPTYHAGAIFRELLKSGNWLTLWRELKATSSVTQRSCLSILFSQFVRPFIGGTRSIQPFYKEILNPSFLERYADEKSEARPDKVYWSLREEQYDNLLGSQKTSARFGDLGANCQARRVFPYMDTDILEFCLAAEPSVKYQNGYSRYLIRGALGGVLPNKIRWRTTKAPFSPDHMQRYRLQLGDARAYLSAISSSDPVHQIVNVARLIQYTERSSELQTANLNTVCLGIYLIVFLRQFDEFKA